MTTAAAMKFAHRNGVTIGMMAVSKLDLTAPKFQMVERWRYTKEGSRHDAGPRKIIAVEGVEALATVQITYRRRNWFRGADLRIREAMEELPPSSQTTLWDKFREWDGPETMRGWENMIRRIRLMDLGARVRRETVTVTITLAMRGE